MSYIQCMAVNSPVIIGHRISQGDTLRAFIISRQVLITDSVEHPVIIVIPTVIVGFTLVFQQAVLKLVFRLNGRTFDAG